ACGGHRRNFQAKPTRRLYIFRWPLLFASRSPAIPQMIGFRYDTGTTPRTLMEQSARILVTGGSGMVGRALLKRLRQDGYGPILAPSSKQLDLRDQADTHRFFAEHPTDYVFHLAGHIGGIGASVAPPVELLYETVMTLMTDR